MLLKALQWATVFVCLLMVAGTLASFSRSPRWWVRMWDFPRLQIAVIAAAAGTVYAVFFFGRSLLEWALLEATLLAVLWQLRKIFPYTRFARKQVAWSTRRPAPPGGARTSFRLLITNVRMENTRHDRLLQVIRSADADIILAVETDEAWARALEPLEADYPDVVRHPRDNWYGLMLFSRIPLIDPKVEFLVQDDIPSVHTSFEVGDGVRVFLHGLHPRPPEPIRDQDSTARDAELVLVGRMIGETDDQPTLVAGDLNDVAWSRSTGLFLRLSGLLDPRIGRGLFNSFNAESRIMRYPLDHVFHSRHFRLLDLRLLPYVGSDHFPVLVELSYEPETAAGQEAEPPRESDLEEADEKLEEEAEAARTGDDRPGRE